MKLSQIIFVIVVCLCIAAPAAMAQSAKDDKARDAALRQLQDATKGPMGKSKATGAARFIRLRPEASASLGLSPALSEKKKKKESLLFFQKYGAALGIKDAESLRFVSSVTDRLGETHLTWKQYYGNIPVFAGTIKTHFDASNVLKTVNGTAIPDITVNPNPVWSSKRAAAVALASVVAERGSSDALRIGTKTLLIYREGLARGIPGPNHLAWEIEVTDGAGIRDFVYVSAQTGKFIDRITAIYDDLNRRAYDGKNLPNVPNNYPNGPYWEEGEKFPTNSFEANNMITSSEETYNFFNNTFGRDSFDDNGATMDAIFDRGYQCPNASWNGIFISFCPGFTADDVTSHEWSHAYTQYTDDLIYAWQPGALNESYSDIWGETVDRINNRETDLPFTPRNASACSTFSPPVGQLHINSPAGIAGDYFAQSASFGPELTPTGLTGDVVGTTPLNGCTAITNNIAGKIALINRGTCTFQNKVINAQTAGAIGVIIENNAASGLPPMGADPTFPDPTIPSLGVQQATGESIRNNLPVDATLRANAGTDDSVRWLLGEDVGFSPDADGAIRDMYNPTCYSNPGKVSDTAFYVCGFAGDNGGVHFNSGVPNHAYALLVDGGTYNGQTITAIGLIKAAHIYFRAQTVYQSDASDFADHADALESSCNDLATSAQPLTDFTGATSGETISGTDCDQVANAIAAVELRTDPTFCNFQPLLNPTPPALCSATTTTGAVQNITSFDFESNPVTWTISRLATSPDFTSRDWTWTSDLPDPNATSGFFAPDPNIGNCTPGTDESGVLTLTSPPINLPNLTNFARVSFDHWVATEPTFDGGNLRISVNDGPFQLLPASAFTFNSYSGALAASTNPLTGQPAWNGSNAGSVDQGSWGRTDVNVGNFAGPGSSIRLRWDFGTDCATGSEAGWYLDNVNVYSCTANVPSISIANIEVEEGNSGDTPAVFTVSLSAPTIKAVAVNFQTFDGTAKHGSDFVEATGTVVIPGGSQTGRITILLKGNTVPEPDETFFLRLSGAVNATLAPADSLAQGTILNDD